jgi:hypothetical protein
MAYRLLAWVQSNIFRYASAVGFNWKLL